MSKIDTFEDKQSVLESSHKILLISVVNIALIPPAMSVYNSMTELGYNVHVLSDGQNDIIENFTSLNVNYRSFADKSLLSKYSLYLRVKESIKKYIDNNYCAGDKIYFIGNATMKYIPENIVDKDYFLHFLEFADDIYLFAKLKLFKVPIETYCDKARCVVTCEENRAFLMSAKWNLKNVPKVLPNKPYLMHEYQRNNPVSDGDARRVLESIDGKKIILYQGRQGKLNKERNLYPFYEAIDELGDDYIFAVMSPKEDNVQAEVMNHNAVSIPYIAPPNHLEVTSHAYIGVATYEPTGSFTQGINVLYCAPNKIYEYSMFGIPMIGNKIPGLLETIGKYGAGICSDLTKDAVKKSILSIEDNYAKMSENSLRFYNNVNVSEILSEILKM